MKEISLSTDQLFTQTTTLSGSDFIFTFSWNAREGAWYFDLADQDGVPILLSIKITVNWPFGARCLDPRMPPGILAAVDLTEQDLDPELEDLGNRVRLMYIEPGDKPS